MSIRIPQNPHIVRHVRIKVGWDRVNYEHNRNHCTMGFERDSSQEVGAAAQEQGEHRPEIAEAIRELERIEQALRAVDRRIAAFPNAQTLVREAGDVLNAVYMAAQDAIPGVGAFRSFVLNTLRESTSLKWNVPPYTPQGLNEVLAALKDWNALRAEIAAGDAPLLAERDALHMEHNSAAEKLRTLLVALHTEGVE